MVTNEDMNMRFWNQITIVIVGGERTTRDVLRAILPEGWEPEGQEKQVDTTDEEIEILMKQRLRP